jgi:hypothetical protein
MIAEHHGNSFWSPCDVTNPGIIKGAGKKSLDKSLHKLQFKEITQIWQRQDVCTFKKGFSVLVVRAVDDPNCRLLLTKQFGNCTCRG